MTFSTPFATRKADSLPLVPHWCELVQTLGADWCRPLVQEFGAQILRFLVQLTAKDLRVSTLVWHQCENLVQTLGAQAAPTTKPDESARLVQTVRQVPTV